MTTWGLPWNFLLTTRGLLGNHFGARSAKLWDHMVTSQWLLGSIWTFLFPWPQKMQQLFQIAPTIAGVKKKSNHSFQMKSVLLFRIESWQIWKDLVDDGFWKLLKDTMRRTGGVAGQFNGCPSIWKNCRLRLSPLFSLVDRAGRWRYRHKRSLLIGRERGRAQRKLMFICRNCAILTSDWSELPPN